LSANSSRVLYHSGRIIIVEFLIVNAIFRSCTLPEDVGFYLLNNCIYLDEHQSNRSYTCIQFGSLYW
jgi:hypothetical protein